MKRERAENLFSLLGEIDDEIIAEADIIKKKTAKVLQIGKKKGMGRFATIAASIAFLLVCIWGVRGLLGQFGLEGDDEPANDGLEFMTGDNGADWADDVAEAEVADEWEDDDEDDLAEEGLADHPVDYVHQLTDEQLDAVFPGLEYEVSAVAFFLNDGTLIEVEGIIQLPTGQQMRIRVAEDEIQDATIVVPEEISRFRFHNVEVEVCNYETVRFMLGNIAYYIEFYDEDVVNKIILGGPADLSVLQ